MKKLAAILFFLALPITVNAQSVVVSAVTTNHSVIITTGATFQTILAKAFYRSMTFQNNNTNTDNCWITFGKIGSTTITAANATAATSVLLAPGQAFTRYFPYIPYDEIEGTCATTSDTIYVDFQ